MADPFDSSRRKIARAKYHIEDLNTKIIQLQAERPYEMFIEADPAPGYKVHKFRLTKPVPAVFPVVIGDAVTNLRAALDHIIYACAISSGTVNPSFRTCCFPFGKDATAFENAVKGCTAVPEEIRACLRRFRCYEGGHDAIWALNVACNWDKHALITPIVMGFETIEVTVKEGAFIMPLNAFWDRSKNEIALFRENTNPKYDVAFALNIALDGPNILAFKPVVRLFHSLVDVVQSILMAIEAEMRRLFPAAFA